MSGIKFTSSRISHRKTATSNGAILWAIFLCLGLPQSRAADQPPPRGLTTQEKGDLYLRLRSGDLAALDVVISGGSENDLLTFYWDARSGQFADSINATALSRLKAAVIAIPGIAFKLGRNVEAKTQSPGNAHAREDILLYLGELGTDECVAVLGSFLHDERDPDKPYRWIDGEEIPGVSSLWNAQAAAGGLGRVDPPPPGAPDWKPYQWKPARRISMWRTWWASDDAAKYREILAKHQADKTAALQSAPESKKTIPPPVPQPPTATAVTDAASPANRIDDLWLWLILALGLLIAVLIPLTIWRRSRR